MWYEYRQALADLDQAQKDDDVIVFTDKNGKKGKSNKKNAHIHTRNVEFFLHL